MFDEKVCTACGMNPVRSPHAIRCESCEVAVRKMAANVAVYRHRLKAKAGKTRHNMTYRGQPTKYAVEEALRILLQRAKLVNQ